MVNDTQYTLYRREKYHVVFIDPDTKTEYWFEAYKGKEKSQYKEGVYTIRKPGFIVENYNISKSNTIITHRTQAKKDITTNKIKNPIDISLNIILSGNYSIRKEQEIILNKLNDKASFIFSSPISLTIQSVTMQSLSITHSGESPNLWTASVKLKEIILHELDSDISDYTIIDPFSALDTSYRNKITWEGESALEPELRDYVTNLYYKSRTVTTETQFWSSLYKTTRDTIFRPGASTKYYTKIDRVVYGYIHIPETDFLIWACSQPDIREKYFNRDDYEDSERIADIADIDRHSHTVQIPIIPVNTTSERTAKIYFNEFYEGWLYDVEWTIEQGDPSNISYSSGTKEILTIWNQIVPIFFENVFYKFYFYIGEIYDTNFTKKSWWSKKFGIPTEDTLIEKISVKPNLYLSIWDMDNSRWILQNKLLKKGEEIKTDVFKMFVYEFGWRSLIMTIRELSFGLGVTTEPSDEEEGLNEEN